jgi:broad specificity phosphatase PhoE
VSDSQPIRPIVRFVRHGATAANVLGLRCGGDLDLDLVAEGREQAAQVARHIALLDPPVRLIVTSGLRRTLETAHIIAGTLGRVTLLVEPEFAERRLGEWNLRSIERTQSWFDQRLTPPGGESSDAFAARIERAARRLMVCLPQAPLLVGSKGVARVLGELSGNPAGRNLRNAGLVEFDLSGDACLATAGEMT